MAAAKGQINIKIEPVVDTAIIGTQRSVQPTTAPAAEANMPESVPGGGLVQPAQPPSADLRPDADTATPAKLHELLMQLTSTTSATAAMLAQQQQHLLAQQQLQQQQVMALLTRSRSSTRDALLQQQSSGVAAATATPPEVVTAAVPNPAQGAALNLIPAQASAPLASPFLSVSTDKRDSSGQGPGKVSMQALQHSESPEQSPGHAQAHMMASKLATEPTMVQPSAARCVGGDLRASQIPSSQPSQLEPVLMGGGGSQPSPASHEQASGSLPARRSTQSSHEQCQVQQERPLAGMHLAQHGPLAQQDEDDLLGSLWHSNSQPMPVNPALESMTSVSSEDMAAAAAAAASRPLLHVPDIVTNMQRRHSSQLVLPTSQAPAGSTRAQGLPSSAVVAAVAADSTLTGWLSRQPSSVQQQFQHRSPGLVMNEEDRSAQGLGQGNLACLNSVMWGATQGPAQQACSNGPSMSQSGGGANTPTTMGAPATSSGAGGQLTYPPAEASNAAVMADRELFMTTLKRLHEALGTRFRIPVVGGQELDLWLLYRQVVAHDGLAVVILHKKWADVCQPFNFPATFTSRSFTMRKTYSQILWHYEQVYMHGNTGPLVAPPAPDTLGASTPHHNQHNNNQNHHNHNQQHQQHQHGVQSLGVQYVQAAKRQRTHHGRHSSCVDTVMALPTPSAQAATVPVSLNSPWDAPASVNQGFQLQQGRHSNMNSPPAMSAMRVDAVGITGLENVGVGTSGQFVVTQRVDHGFFVELQLGGARFRGMLYCPPEGPAVLPTPAAAPPHAATNMTRSGVTAGVTSLQSLVAAATAPGTASSLHNGLARQVTWPHTTHMVTQSHAANLVRTPSELYRMQSIAGMAPQNLMFHGVSPDMAEAANHLLSMD